MFVLSCTHEAMYYSTEMKMVDKTLLPSEMKDHPIARVKEGCIS